MWRVLIWLWLAGTLVGVDSPWSTLSFCQAGAADTLRTQNTSVQPTADSRPLNTPARRVLTVLTNTFGADDPDFGALLIGESVGALEPLLATNTVPAPFSTNAVITIGTTNSWHFYAITNSPGYSNAVFLTFLSQPPPQFPTGTNPLAKTDIDIDLYVSRDPGLTNLDPAAIQQADVSLSRGGSETVIYTNAASAVYYIGVKCESPLGARYNLAVDFSPEPFVQIDSTGDELLRGFPAPTTATSAMPAYLLHVTPDSFPVRRIIVTNRLSAASPNDLRLMLTHQNSSVVLQNGFGAGAITNATLVYDDSHEQDIAGALASSGPGSLTEFGGQNSKGQWLLSLTTTNQPATNHASWIYLERQVDMGGGAGVVLLPGACREDFVNVPLGASALTLPASITSGTGSISLQAYPAGFTSSNCPVLTVSAASASGELVLDQTTMPPLRPGIYVVETCNPGPDSVDVSLQDALALSQNASVTNLYTSTNHVVLNDQSLTTSSVTVTNPGLVASVQVGVRLNDPRVSDLVLSLIAPDGTRVLLDAQRGGISTGGIGADFVVTNTTPVDFFGGPQAVTNLFETGRTAGSILISYDFFSLPDEMRVYYETNLLFDSGMISFSGATNLQYGPGSSTAFSVVMNPEGNPQPSTAWHYSVTTTAPEPEYLTFTEDTNLAAVAIKFAPASLTNSTFSPLDGSVQAGIFYLPEQPLSSFAGKVAAGQWTLEIWDRGSDATNLSSPRLLSWQLALVLANLVSSPVIVDGSVPVTNLLGPGELQWYSIPVPDWVSFATNALITASAPVNVFYNPASPPTGTNAGDLALAFGATTGAWTFRTNSSPGLMPGSTYYLGIQNTNPTTVSVSVGLSFDINQMVTLSSGVAYPNSNAGPLGSADFYRYLASTNAARLQFEINGPTVDLTLVARKGPPPPNLNNGDYTSANPGTNDELIVINDFSQPLSLNPGEWFITVVNVTGAPASYSIMATESSVTGTNLALSEPVVSTNSICVTWNSVPGAHYYVEAKASVSDPQWSRVSSTLTATDTTSTYCEPLPSPYQYFRVSEGLVLVPALPAITSIVRTSKGFLLQWLGTTNSQFSVQWTPSLAPALWHALPGTVTSSNGTFVFLDSGSASGGLASPRFYRLLQTE